MPTSKRLVSVDALRGLVMVIMALDHVRDFFHSAAMSQSPTDLAVTTPAIFLTRWITHFCAPVFLFVAGVGAFLWLGRGARTKGELSRYLLSRGAWLIAVELVVMRVAFDFSLHPKFPVLLITLWSLGASMIALAALIYLPLRALAFVSAAVILLHNLADGVQAASWGGWAWVWNLLHQPGAFVAGGVLVVVGYPLLPLLATMSVGYCAGHLIQTGNDRMLLRIGAAMTVLFVVLRGINVYGDPSRWAMQHSHLLTLLSFLNTTKYPASLDFLLMTLGPALLLLGWQGGAKFSPANPLIVFGRVPFFYFIVHFYWIHLLLVAAGWLRYGWAPFLLLPPPSMGGPRELFPPGFGYSLWTVYALWGFVVATMYPVCRWFAEVKRTRRHWWLGYL